MNLTPFWITLKVAGTATLLLFVVGLTAGWILARWRFRGQMIVETLLALPLVLPPTVVGYYLLVMLGRQGPFSKLGLETVFTWQAAAVASAVMGLPLMVEAARAAIADVDRRLEQAARSLGASEWRVALQVTLPLARNGILAGLLLGGARALGEFGATLMVAGNIPGQTQTVPLAIYDAMQGGQTELAHRMVLAMTLLAFLSLAGVRYLTAGQRRSWSTQPAA